MSDLPRCATCRHWHNDRYPNVAEDHDRQCQRLSDEDEESGSLRSSGGEYAIWTRRDFGCIFHEPQEGES